MLPIVRKEHMRNLHCGATFRVFVIVLATMLGASGMAGCAAAAPEISIRARVFLERPPVDRLLVFASVKSRFFDDGMYAGFQEGMARLLESCHVTHIILHKDRLALDERESPDRATEALRPQAILRIESRGGSFSSEGGWNQTSFSLNLNEASTMYTTWGGEAKFTAKSVGDNHAGRRLAAEIVSDLRDDGVLARCPAGDLFQALLPEAHDSWGAP